MEPLLAAYKELAQRTKVLLAIIMLLGFGAYAYFETIEPSEVQLAQARSEYEDLLKKATELNKVTQSTAVLEETERKVRAELNELQESLPLDAEMEKILGVLADIAKENLVEIKSFTPAEEVAFEIDPKAVAVETALPEAPSASPMTVAPSATKKQSKQEKISVFKVPFKVVVKGAFPQVMLFMDKALSLQRIIRVETYKINVLSPDSLFTTSPQVKVQADLSLATFIQKLPAEVEKTKSPVKLPAPPALAQQPATMQPTTVPTNDAQNSLKAGNIKLPGAENE